MRAALIASVVFPEPGSPLTMSGRPVDSARFKARMICGE
jgi:hypothetical protein